MTADVSMREIRFKFICSSESLNSLLNFRIEFPGSDELESDFPRGLRTGPSGPLGKTRAPFLICGLLGKAGLEEKTSSLKCDVRSSE